MRFRKLLNFSWPFTSNFQFAEHLLYSNKVCLSQGNKLKEALLPSLNLLTESARVHRETRKFLRSRVSNYGF